MTLDADLFKTTVGYGSTAGARRFFINTLPAGGILKRNNTTLSVGSSFVDPASLQYIPNDNFSGADSFQFSARDSNSTYPTEAKDIFTTTRDDRVGPQHARKFAARMEELGLPYYFYENTEGGHGSGADIKQSAHTAALRMVYFIQKLMD